MSNWREYSVALIGCGSLGTNVISLIHKYNFSNITLIDLDYVSESNLTQSTIFTIKDIGKPKSKILYEYLLKKNIKYNINYYVRAVETINIDNYSILILATDNLESRIWVMQKILIRNTKCKYILDAGLSGYRAHIQIILPGKTPCILCNLSLYDTIKIPICSIPNIPKSKEHCIYLAMNNLKLSSIESNNIKKVQKLSQELSNKYINSREITEIDIKLISKQIIPTSIITIKIVALLIEQILFNSNNINIDLSKNYFQIDILSEINITPIYIKPNLKCLCKSPIYKLKVSSLNEIIEKLPIDPIYILIEDKIIYSNNIWLNNINLLDIKSNQYLLINGTYARVKLL